MTKKELVGKIAEATTLTKADSERALNAFLSTVEEALKKGEKVQLVGFGTFETQERPAGLRKNPLTGETMEISSKKVPKFKPGKALKDIVNN